MAIESRLHQNIVDFLITLPFFQSKNGRRAILLNAGLDKVLPTINLSGSTAEFIPLLIEQLDQYGSLF